MTLRQLYASGNLKSDAKLSDLYGHYGTIRLVDLAGHLHGVTLGDVKKLMAGVTLGQMKGHFPPGFRFDQLGTYGTLTLADVIKAFPAGTTLQQVLLAILRPQSYDWENANIFAMQPQDWAIGGGHFDFRASFTLAGVPSSTTTSATVKVTVPDGFHYVAGTSVLEPLTAALPEQPLADPVATGNTLAFTVDGLVLGTPYVIDFETTSSLESGPGQAAMSITSGAATENADPMPLTVTDSFEDTNNDPATAPTISTDSLYLSGISSSTDRDYYSLVAGAAGTRYTVKLSHLPADYDVVVYGPASTEGPVTGTTAPPLDGQPVQSGGTGGGAVAPEALQDVPLLAGQTVYNFGINRDLSNESVSFFSPSAGAHFLIQVTGFNGASSPKPYVLRAVERLPRSFGACTVHAPAAGGPGVAALTLPNATDLTNVDTLFVMNEKLWGDTHGLAEENAIIQAITDPARAQAFADMGHKAALVGVEADPAVATAWSAQQADMCDPALSNGTARAINDLIARLAALSPTIKNVVLIGPHTMGVPQFLISDTTSVANETGYAGSVAGAGNNPYYEAIAKGYLFTDAPWVANAVPWLNRYLYIRPPRFAVGRLVESTTEIVNAIDAFVNRGGLLPKDSTLNTGYDFIADGARRIATANEATVAPGTGTRLINETWTRQNFADALTAGANLIGDNAHFNHYALLPASQNAAHREDDLFTTNDLAAMQHVDGSFAFSVGCHSAFNVADGTGTANDVDWPQAWARRGALSAGNTGYGIGDSDGVSWSERMWALYSESLSSHSLGSALTDAARRYIRTNGVFSVYDEKAVEESTLYGMPGYQLGVLTAPPPDPPSPPTADEPVAGLQASSFDVQPQNFTLQHGAKGDYYSVDGGNLQFVQDRPIVSALALPAPAGAKGALLTRIATADNGGPSGPGSFDPAIATPVEDSSATRPEPQPSDVVFPTKQAWMSRELGSDGAVGSSLVLMASQFFTTDGSAPGHGVMRNFTRLAGEIYTSSDTSYTPDTFTKVDVLKDGTTVTFAADVADPGTCGHARRVLVLYRDDSGNWTPLDLARTPGTDHWTAAAVVSGTVHESFLQAVACNGTVAASTFKGRYYEAQPIPVGATPPGAGAITIVPAGATGSNGYFTSAPTISLASTSATAVISYRIDGGAAIPYGAPFTLTAQGTHVIEADGSDGARAFQTVKIDTEIPRIVVTVPTEGQIVKARDAVPAKYSCVDAGEVTCTGSVVDGSPLDSSTLGVHTFTVTATDAAGNAAVPTTIHYTVIKNNRPPTAPGAPVATPPLSEGTFALAWTPSTDPDDDPVTYTLQQKNRVGAYADVAAGLTSPAFSIVNEPEGTWNFRVVASDGDGGTSISDVSADVKVDLTPPDVSLDGATPADYAGGGSWWKDSVTVVTSAVDHPLADGSAGSGIKTRSADQVLTATGMAQGNATDLLDHPGSASRLFQIDSAAPAISFSVCPSVVDKDTLATATYGASDLGSGLATPATETVTLDASSYGPQTLVETARDNVGHVTSATCSYMVNGPPTAPGVPATASPVNQGQFSLTWDAATDATPTGSLSYALQHKHWNQADTGWADAASAILAPSYVFYVPPEAEGTYEYRVRATDGRLYGDYSAASADVKVDQSNPNDPSLAADRAPDFGPWYKDSVVVTTTDNGDRKLVDGSDGSGIASVTGPQTITRSGVDPVTGTATDKVGHASSFTQYFDVDSTGPVISVYCPTTPVILGSVRTASFSASDDQSGLATSATGTVALDTSKIGTFYAIAAATDNVGHQTTGSCSYTVIWDFAGFFSPVNNLPTINVAKAGSAVPVKFTLGGDQGLAIFATGYPRSVAEDCSSGATTDLIEETVTAGGSTLTYDGSQYVYVWKTPSTWLVGSCHQLVIGLADGTFHRANFKAK